MNPSAPFIRRPVMTVLVMLSLLLFGAMAYLKLPVSDLPTVDYPTLQVSASVPGASPQTMASAVATVLERQFSTIAGLDSMSSSSIQGTTTITLQFNLSRTLDEAALDVQAAISRAAKQLPPEMPTPPSYQKVNPADQPFLYLALTSPTLPMWELNRYGETLLSQRISTVDGVAQVQVLGSQKYAVRIRVDPEKLFVRGIGIDEVVAAVRGANVNRPTGVLYGPHNAFTVQANGQLLKAADYRAVIVAQRDGRPVRLGDVATAEDGVENDRIAAWYYTPEQRQRSVILAIQRQPGRNTVEVADRVKALLPTFRGQLPESVQMNVLTDRSLSIRRSVDEAQFTLVLTLVLVVLVIFVFLRTLSATFIPSLALPMSLVGTFMVMYLLDYSLDNLSLMALTLAIGFVVDDAIVMLENIVRHVENGKSPMQAAMDGSKEIAFTIVSMTISLAAVFIPVMFMGGLVGRLFREFAVTIGVAVLVSGFISLSLTPMLCSRYLRPASAGRHGRLYRAGERLFDGLAHGYGRSLGWALRHRGLTMLIAAATIAPILWLSTLVPKGFLPNEDQDMIYVQLEAAEGISPVSMFQHQKAAAAVIQKEPHIVAFMSSSGSRLGSGQNTGRIITRLTPRESGRPAADLIVQTWRGKLAQIPGLRAFVQVPSTFQIGGRMSKSLYQFTLQGPDLPALYACADKLLDRARALPGFVDVTTDMQLRNPELDVHIDRDRASSMGVSVDKAEEALLYAFSTPEISTMYTDEDQYRVLLDVPPEYQSDEAALSLIRVRSSSGGLVPLTSFATVRRGAGPLSVNHSGQMPSVTLSFNLAPGAALGPAIEALDSAAQDLIPAGVTTSFQGTAQAFQSSMKGMGLLLILAVVVIYIVLGVLYESYAHPVTILTALPFAGVGALLALYLFGAELNIYAFVGIIMLVGLVKKNGIMMVDFAIEAQRSGKSPMEAIHEASVVRFRPIMMTTMAALMAGLPIALGYGAGGEARRPLGLAVVGGLVFSQTLTLFVTPVFYLLMEGWRQRAALRRRPAPAPAEGGAP